MLEPSAPPSTPADRFAEWLIRILRERHRQEGIIGRTRSLLRPVLWALSICYFAALVALYFALRWKGEEVPALGFILYLPHQLWLLPVFILAPVCMIFRPVLGLLHAGCGIFIAIALMGFRWPFHVPAPAGENATVTVVTNNRGQDNGNSLTPFLQAENPDFVVLQEDGRGEAFSRAYPDRFCLSHGEFTLVSKLPIKDSGFVESPTWNGSPIAAWFLVEFGGQPLVIYSVHMPTPRNELYKMRGLGLAAVALPLPGRRFAAFRGRAQEVWSERVKVAEEFAAVLAKEPRRAIVAGDFNMPRGGHIYPMFSAMLHDAFEECGRGFGFTLPGVTRNPLSLYGPWMRIDYVFSNHRLRPFYVRTEPHRHSQHRAVAARLEIID